MPNLFSFEAEQGLRRRMPELSASVVITREQTIVFCLLAAAALAFTAYWHEAAYLAIVVFGTVSFLAGTGFRGFLMLRGGEVEQPSTLAVADENLPIYTILIPLYREAAVLPRLAQELSQLDYPDTLAQTPQAI